MLRQKGQRVLLWEVIQANLLFETMAKSTITVLHSGELWPYLTRLTSLFQTLYLNLRDDAVKKFYVVDTCTTDC
jgi:hypothetical protein